MKKTAIAAAGIFVMMSMLAGCGGMIQKKLSQNRYRFRSRNQIQQRI